MGLRRLARQLREESASYEAARASARTASPGQATRATPRDRAEDMARVKARTRWGWAFGMVSKSFQVFCCDLVGVSHW